jgi:hypothetical protein
MNEVRLRPVSYSELSALRHEVAISESAEFEAKEFLVIRYFGSYRDGGAGRGDFQYILATAAAAREAWYCTSTILDFRSLEYHWGDNMLSVTDIVWDPRLRLHWPMAIVVGDGCRDALRSCLQKEYDCWCVETLEDAFALCRQKSIERDRELNERCNRSTKPVADLTVPAPVSEIA